MSAADGRAAVTERVAPETVVRAASGDLGLLARLHDREPDRELLTALRSVPFRDHLGLELRRADSRAALAQLDRGLGTLPGKIDDAVLDIFAADFADIYLTHAIRAGTSESVWLDDEHLERQEPMFEVRKWYRHYGLRVENWRLRPDDHLVHELQFLAFLLDRATFEAVRDAARFADRHLLRWIGNFADTVASRCRTVYFAGLARLTHGYLEELRDLLEEITGERRWVPPSPAGNRRRGCAVEQPYVPGAGPSW